MINPFHNLAPLALTKLIAISVDITSDGYRYAYISFQIKNGELLVIEYEKNLVNIDSIKSQISIEMPAIISVQGKGILSKKTIVHQHEDFGKVLNRILPNAEVTDFYLSINKLYDEDHLVSIVRKSVVEQALSILPEKLIINLSIGPNAILSLINYTDEAQIVYKNFNWFKNGSNLNFEPQIDITNPNTFKLGGDRIPIECAEAYGHAIAFVSGQNEGFVVDPIFEDNYIQAKQFKKFKLAGWISLITILIILLINFLVFSNFNKKNASLSEQLLTYGNLLSEIDTLEHQVVFKEDFVKNNNIKHTRFSFIADQLAKSTPNTIVWTNLIIQPVEKKIKQDKEAIFTKNKIVIKGTAKNSKYLKDWLTEIRNFDWVSNTEIVEYIQESAELSGTFEINILLNDF